MLFMSDETLLTVIEWALAFVCGAIVIALPLAIAARRILSSEVLSPSALLQETTGERSRKGDLIEPSMIKVWAYLYSWRG